MDELILHRYMDGRLGERERREVEETLRNDPAARRTLDALREEARLIRGAFEAQVEPSRRLAEKISVQLHLEERERAGRLRTRRLFTRLGKIAVGVAALLMVAMFVKPRSPSGAILSGSNVTVLVHGEKRDAQAGTKLYEGDELSTARGQFVRFVFSEGAFIDLDEESRLTIESGSSGARARLMNGRMGVVAGERQEAVQIDLPDGAVATVTPGTKADIWLPQEIRAHWPALYFPPGHFAHETGASNPKTTDSKPVLVTVFKGVVRIQPARSQETTPVLEGTRAALEHGKVTARRVSLSGSRVLEVRGEEGPHTRDAKTSRPVEWVEIGLLARPEFETLGRKLGLLTNAPAEIGETLKQLDIALQEKDHAARAEKIAPAQHALRLACQTLPKEDVRRRFGLTLEGLAHFEEGRARFMTQNAAAGDDPHAPFKATRASFDAARVAFENALEAGKKPTETQNSEWQSTFASGETPALNEVAPLVQSALLAELRRGAALYWKGLTLRAEMDAPGKLDATAMAELAQEFLRNHDDATVAFARLHREMGHSIESQAALFGEALCYELQNNDAGRRKALDALQLLAAKPLSGGEPPARARFEGIRQAALLELVRVNALGRENGDAAKTLDAMHDFTLAYPLDARSPAAEAVRSELKKGLERQAALALKENRYDAAVEACDALLIALDEFEGRTEEMPNSEIRHIGVHLDLLDALLGAKDWPRARREVDALEGRLPEELKPRFETLRKKLSEAIKK